MFLSRGQNAKQNHNFKTTSQPFENVENFNYFVWTMTDKSTVNTENERRINSGNALLGFYPESVLLFATENTNIEICNYYHWTRTMIIQS